MELLTQLTDSLHRAREAYGIADRIESESDNLDGAITNVKEAAATLHERFASIESSPSALPGRLKALASVIKTQKHILEKGMSLHINFSMPVKCRIYRNDKS